MDECIGSIMPLYDILSNLPKLVSEGNTSHSENHIKYEMMRILFDSEQARKTWLLSHAMFSALKHLYKAFQSNQIYGAFILSNNGSFDLVCFVACFLNYSVWRLFDTQPNYPNIFKMAMWIDAPPRRKYGSIKNYEVIQACLKAEGLPECSSRNDLLFFDDISHPLQNEISNYVRVSPYLFQTEINTLIETLTPMQPLFKGEIWSKLVNETRLSNKRDFARPTNTYKAKPQPLDDTVRDIKMFRNAFTNFAKSSKGGTRKHSRRNKSDEFVSI